MSRQTRSSVCAFAFLCLLTIPPSHADNQYALGSHLGSKHEFTAKFPDSPPFRHRQQEFGPSDCGVGFHFSYDYGVASVAFPNGSATNVAMIHGGPAYRELMLRMANASKTTDTTQNSHPLEYGALESMTEALKAATEAFLGEFHHAASAMPFNLTVDQQSELRSMLPPSCRRNGKIGTSASNAARMLCADAYYDEEYLLVIEEGRAAFTASLILSDYPFLEIIRVMHSPIHEFTRIPKPSEANLIKLEAQLSEFANLEAFNDHPHRRRPKEVSALFRFGRATENPHLTGILRRVFGNRYEKLAETVDFNRHRNTGGVYAASHDLAKGCSAWLNDYTFSCTEGWQKLSREKGA